MLTRLVSQLTERQLEQFINNISPDGRRSLKILLADEDAHISRLNLDPVSLDIRKLAMKPKKTAEEEQLLQTAQKAWAGRVDGRRRNFSKETLDAVNAHLKYYDVQKQFIGKMVDAIQERGDIFFGVPISRHLRNQKEFKRLLMQKTLSEPHVIRRYLEEFLEAYNNKEVIRPFAPDTKLYTLAQSLNPKVFDEYKEALYECVVSNMNHDIVTMLETLMMKSAQADKMFNETVWRETADILPIFHPAHLKYLYLFFSLFLINTKTRVLPRYMSEMAIIAYIRKVEELC